MAAPPVFVTGAGGFGGSHPTDLTGSEGDVAGDTSEPDGQPRRTLDTTRAKERFDWEAETAMAAARRETVGWCERGREVAPI